MSGTSKLLVGAAVGAGLVYFVERPLGSRRRALMRDRVAHLVHDAGDAGRIVRSDLENRSQGTLARLRRLFTPDHADDTVVRERVRSALGRHCLHPHAIETRVRGGKLELSGPILAAEHARVISALSLVRGVREIQDRLEAHETPDLPTLQGVRRHERALDEGWSAAARFATGTLGAMALVRGFATGGASGLGFGLIGAALVGRSVGNRPIGRLLSRRNTITIRKSIEIARPVEDVWAYLTAFDQYPRFMSHVAEVQRLDGLRYHWKVEGPLGARYEWDGIVTKRIPHELLAWRSTRGAAVGNTGRVRFESISPGVTRIDVFLQYSPPGGVVGHAFASLFGADPKHALDDDLMRLQSLLEHGRTTGHERVSERDLSDRISH